MKPWRTRWVKISIAKSVGKVDWNTLEADAEDGRPFDVMIYYYEGNLGIASMGNTSPDDDDE